MQRSNRSSLLALAPAHAPGVQRARDPLEERSAAGEVEAIMLRRLGPGEEPKPKACWLGVSPPSRAMNGLVQDAHWLRHADRGSRSNLVALREIDAQGEVSFMRCSSQAGDSRLLLESPEFGLLAGAEAAAAAPEGFTFRTQPRPIPAGPVSSWKGARCNGSRPAAVPLVCQNGFFVA